MKYIIKIYYEKMFSFLFFCKLFSFEVKKSFLKMSLHKNSILLRKSINFFKKPKLGKSTLKYFFVNFCPIMFHQATALQSKKKVMKKY